MRFLMIGTKWSPFQSTPMYCIALHGLYCIVLHEMYSIVLHAINCIVLLALCSIVLHESMPWLVLHEAHFNQHPADYFGGLAGDRRTGCAVFGSLLHCICIVFLWLLCCIVSLSSTCSVCNALANTRRRCIVPMCIVLYCVIILHYIELCLNCFSTPLY